MVAENSPGREGRAALRSASDPLRPKSLKEFEGQPDINRHLDIILQAATRRGEISDHILFSGPPGCGKTTLSHIIADELQLPLVITSGPAMEAPKDLAVVLTRLAAPSVVFIDEIHRMSRHIEEFLYPAMEDGVFDIMVGEGSDSRMIQIPLQPFVLVGATTQAGMLSAPLRDRFGYHGRLGLYNIEALQSIVERSGHLLELVVSTEGAHAVAERSRGTPRVANRLLRRVRDWNTIYNQDGRISADEAQAALDAFGIDRRGLDDVAREILEVLCTVRQGSPVGLGQIASLVGEDPRTVEEVYEPFLLQQKLISRTQRGRVATLAAYKHLGLPSPGPDGNQIHGEFGLPFGS